VLEHKTIRLEFADRLTLGVVDGPRELVSIGRYSPGNWEDRLKEAYDECLRLTVTLDEVTAAEDKLAKSETPEDVVGLLDSAQDREAMLRLLCLSSKRSTNAYTLFMSHILADRIVEAHHIIDTAVELNPTSAMHLTLGNFYWAALSNAKGWGSGKEPGPLRAVTLDSLDMSYEKARSLARTHYLEAMRLSSRREIEEEPAPSSPHSARSAALLSEGRVHTRRSGEPQSKPYLAAEVVQKLHDVRRQRRRLLFAGFERASYRISKCATTWARSGLFAARWSIVSVCSRPARHRPRRYRRHRGPEAVEAA
jgi:hypothetical protein